MFELQEPELPDEEAHDKILDSSLFFFENIFVLLMFSHAAQDFFLVISSFLFLFFSLSTKFISSQHNKYKKNLVCSNEFRVSTDMRHDEKKMSRIIFSSVQEIVFNTR